jgi:hypothetical protein
MNWIPNIFRRRKLYDDLSEEIRLHIEERTEQLIGEGMSPRQAEQQARRAFGNRTLLEERSREVWQWPTLESIWADVRLVVRQLRRSPGFTFAAVLTLALAIGANAVVFAVLNALILRPLNVPNAESLYTIERGVCVELRAHFHLLRGIFYPLPERKLMVNLVCEALSQFAVDREAGGSALIC